MKEGETTEILILSININFTSEEEQPVFYIQILDQVYEDYPTVYKRKYQLAPL